MGLGGKRIGVTVRRVVRCAACGRPACIRAMGEGGTGEDGAGGTVGRGRSGHEAVVMRSE